MKNNKNFKKIVFDIVCNQIIKGTYTVYPFYKSKLDVFNSSCNEKGLSELILELESEKNYLAKI